MLSEQRVLKKKSHQLEIAIGRRHPEDTSVLLEGLGPLEEADRRAAQPLREDVLQQKGQE